MLINREQVIHQKTKYQIHIFTFVYVLSFFSNRKPKQFKYKPRYQKKENSEGKRKPISFKEKPISDAMYDRYDRTRFNDLRKAGQQRMLIKATVLAILIVLLILYLDQIEEMLKKIK
ncbi:MAG: hypothetical protein CMP61_06435 [Flavobacteriales bacterium]|nr:hypothetical protein [Flavobacteriales bacterium]